MKQVLIYTDGSARRNPEGPGGYGAVLRYTDERGKTHTKELSDGFPRTTNNRMELMAAIAALEALKVPCEVELHSDSKYLVDAFNKNWIPSWIRRGWKKSDGGPVLNRDLWERLLTAAQPHTIRWVWVKGHDGNELNERCDTLATEAADRAEESGTQGVRGDGSF